MVICKMFWFCSEVDHSTWDAFLIFTYSFNKLNGYVILQLLGHKGLGNSTDQKSLT